MRPKNLIHIFIKISIEKEVRQDTKYQKTIAQLNKLIFYLVIFLNCSFTFSSNHSRRPQNNVCLTLGKLKCMEVLIRLNGSELKYQML